MSFWSGETLTARLGALIEPFDQEQIDCAAYRLRIGPEVYVSPASDASDAKIQTKVLLADGESFALPSGQFAFLLTEERVTVPSTALAFISIRATIKFRGLVNVSGFHVDPGYYGRLVFSVFNAGPAPVHLARGDDCFLIWYADLDRETAFVKAAAGFDNIPTRLINPIAGEVQSFAGLLSKIKANEKRMDGLAQEQNVVRVIGLIIVAAIAAWAMREFIPTHAPASTSAAPISTQSMKNVVQPASTFPNTASANLPSPRVSTTTTQLGVPQPTAQ